MAETEEEGEISREKRKQRKTEKEEKRTRERGKYLQMYVK